MQSFKSLVRFIHISLVLLGFSISSVNAALMTFTDRANFLAATDSVSVINFGGIAGPGGLVSYADAAGLTLDGVKFVANIADGNLLFVADDTFCCVTYSNRGDNVASLTSSKNNATDNSFIAITLPGGITAVGMDLFSVLVGNHGGTNVDTVNIDIAGGTSQIATVPVGGGTNNDGRVFIGFVSDVPLAFLSVYPTASNTAVDIVNFTFGTAASPSTIPVPAAIWLFGTALIGLVGFGKRRKAA